MKIPRRTGAPPRPSRWAAIVGAAALVTSLAACSSGPAGVVVNLYGGASGTGFDKILANCNEQAAGRYTIVGNLLPSDADGQRDQFVAPARRPGLRHGPAGHGRHLDRRVRRGGLDPGADRRAEGRGHEGHAPAADRHGHVEGQALRRPAHDQRAAAVVPQVAGPEPAEDLGRDDRAGQGAQGRRASPTRSASPPPSTRATWSAINNLVKGFGGTDRQRRQHRRRPSTTRPCRRWPCCRSSPPPA